MVTQGVPAVSELGFAAEVLPKKVKVAAVTGTNGKSTVTTFTGQVLGQASLRTHLVQVCCKHVIHVPDEVHICYW